MTNQIDNIVNHFFNKKNLDEVSETELEQFVQTHPYFAAGHFLLARKIQSLDPEQSRKKIATVALYYNNPLWLQWLLGQEPKNRQAEATSGIQQNTIAPAEVTTEYQPPLPTYGFKDDNRPEGDTSRYDYSTESEEESGKVGDEPGDEHTSQETSTVISSDLEIKSGIHSNQHDEQRHFSGAASHIEDFTQNDGLPATAEDPIIDSSGNTGLHHSKTDVSNDHSDTIESNDNFHYRNGSEDHLTSDEIDPEKNENYGEDEPLNKESAASIGRTLSSAALIPTKADIEKNEFTFEPYHTIDYFASQGIKLQQSELSKDKFGKQLKSFTEWLRSMKRLPEASIEMNLDEATQKSIQREAEHSIEEKEIVTETMAEVWIKQGNREKAIETLHKLSLLNPSKSHYFAAKIEQLKGL